MAKERALCDHHQWGDWQDDQLAELVFGLRSDGADLDLLGFAEKELARLLDEVGVGVGDANVYREPEWPEDAPIIDAIAPGQLHGEPGEGSPLILPPRAARLRGAVEPDGDLPGSAHPDSECCRASTPPGNSLRLLSLTGAAYLSCQAHVAAWSSRIRTSRISPGLLTTAHRQCPKPPCSVTALVHSSR